MTMQPLTTALLDLAHELPKFPSPLYIGGGFGLYLKQRHLERQPALQTLIPGEHWAPARTTEDIDLLLPTEIIINPSHMRSIRAALDRLDYRPEVEHFQFVKQTPLGPVKFDLLTCDVPDEHADKVRLKPPRVQPVEKVQLHAYLTREALALGLAPFEFSLSGRRSTGDAAAITAHIPNPFTYLLMKLHAFRDRASDERKNLASHHALDIYRIISMLTREEFELVGSLRTQSARAGPVREAQAIVRGAFRSADSTGMLRLRRAFADAGLPWSDQLSGDFLSALHDLFDAQTTSDGPTPRGG